MIGNFREVATTIADLFFFILSSDCHQDYFYYYLLPITYYLQAATYCLTAYYLQLQLQLQLLSQLPLFLVD